MCPSLSLVSYVTIVTVVNSCDVGESVFARCLSSLKSERVEASKVLKGKIVSKYDGDKKEFVEHIRKVHHYCQTLLHN